jgi:hypothetical protein
MKAASISSLPWTRRRGEAPLRAGGASPPPEHVRSLSRGGFLFGRSQGAEGVVSGVASGWSQGVANPEKDCYYWS